jgi:hypothetical protein
MREASHLEFPTFKQKTELLPDQGKELKTEPIKKGEGR